MKIKQRLLIWILRRFDIPVIWKVKFQNIEWVGMPPHIENDMAAILYDENMICCDCSFKCCGQGSVYLEKPEKEAR